MCKDRGDDAYRRKLYILTTLTLLGIALMLSSMWFDDSPDATQNLLLAVGGGIFVVFALCLLILVCLHESSHERLLDGGEGDSSSSVATGV